MDGFAQSAGSVRTLAAEMAAESLTSVALVERCLARIHAVDAAVQAWALVLADAALAEAAARDAEAQAGRRRGPLHGIPVGVKDVIDVAGAPTRANCPARADLPLAAADATVVAHLRAAGAVILGKTHTTELAYFQSVPPTRNPHDLMRTPGGSSAGSAAAVAAGMVPLALGTQTAASVNRPAAYCGIGAFKPSTLSVGGMGVVPLAASFDTVGAYGASAADAALLAAGFCGAHVGLDTVSPASGRVRLLTDPLFDAADDETRAAVAELARRMAAEPVASPVPLEEVRLRHRLVLVAELGRTHGGLPRDRVAPRLAEDIAAGLAIPDAEYHDALHALALARRAFWAAFAPDDLLLVPAAPAVAPVGMATGDPSFISPLTALGGPIATVRAGQGGVTGMPVGAVLTARPGRDAHLAGVLLGGDPAL